MARLPLGWLAGLDHVALATGACRRRKPRHFGLTPSESKRKHKILRSEPDTRRDMLVNVRRRRSDPRGTKRTLRIGLRISYRSRATGRKTSGVIKAMRPRNITRHRPNAGWWLFVSARSRLEVCIASEEVIDD